MKQEVWKKKPHKLRKVRILEWFLIPPKKRAVPPGGSSNHSEMASTRAALESGAESSSISWASVLCAERVPAQT